MEMKSKLYIVLGSGHKILQNQKDQIDQMHLEIIYLPKNLQKIWDIIPTHIESVSEHLSSLLDYFSIVLNKNDMVWVQGHMGATYITINHLKSLGIKVIYASMDKVEFDDKNLSKNALKKTSTLEHIRFMEYGV
jgi:hypothetical protein